jgi:hypothetical protein
LSKLYVSQRLPAAYNRAALHDVIRALEEQINALAEGRIVARHAAVSAVPTSGNYAKSDFVWDSAATLANGRVRLGWVNTTAGAPGTLTEIYGLSHSSAPVTNSLGADVALNNTANYFLGPTVAQGTAGTWFASGTVEVYDTAGAASIHAKLWDGTTVIASVETSTPGAGNAISISLSGFLASPAGNIRISVRDVSSTSGVLAFNTTGNSKDSTLSAFRIG